MHYLARHAASAFMLRDTLGWLVLVLALFLPPQVGHARQRSTHSKSPMNAEVPAPVAAPEVSEADADQAHRLATAGAAALNAGQLAEAQQKLERAYSLAPLPDTLYQLGHLAQEQKRTLAAVDLYRRYLWAVGDSIDSKTKALLQQFIGGSHEPPTELDIVSDDNGAILRVDERLMGVLPLNGPLLISAGPHRFKVEKDGKRFQTNPLTVPEKQRAQLRLQLESNYAVLTLTPGVILLIDPPSTPTLIQEDLVRSTAAAVRLERSFLIAREPTFAAIVKETARRPATCIKDWICQESVAKELDAASVLTLTMPAPPAAPRVKAQLTDVTTGMIAATAEEACGECTSKEVQSVAGKLAIQLLQRTASRGRGTLKVSTDPTGVRVLVEGHPLGETPLTREAFEGRHEVTMEKDGFYEQKRTVEVAAEKTAEAQATLKPRPKPVLMTTRPRRSLWRFIAGGTAIGAGIILGGIGASGLALQGSCTQDQMPPALECDYTYNTVPAAAGLLSVGGALAISGVLMIAWPPR